MSIVTDTEISNANQDILRIKKELHSIEEVWHTWLSIILISVSLAILYMVIKWWSLLVLLYTWIFIAELAKTIRDNLLLRSNHYKLLKKKLNESTVLLNKYEGERAKEVKAKRRADEQRLIDQVTYLDGIFNFVFNKKIDNTNYNRAVDFIETASELRKKYIDAGLYFYTTLDNETLLEKTARDKIDYYIDYGNSLTQRLPTNGKLDKSLVEIDGNRSVGDIVTMKSSRNDVNAHVEGLSVKLVDKEDIGKSQEKTSARKNLGSYLHKTNTIDYVKQYESNVELGLKGELIVLQWEKNRLKKEGLGFLSTRVRHVSQELGDSAGYDVLSYDVDEREIFIEVKTTKNNESARFYLTPNEVEKMRSSQSYYIYRLVINNDENAELHIISSNEFNERYDLVPSQFIAKIK